VVIRNVTWVGIAAHAAFVPLFWYLEQPTLARFNVLSVLTWVAAALANRRGRCTLAMWLIAAEVAAHAVLAVTHLGMESGFQYYLLPLIPFVMFNDELGTRTIAVVPVLVLAIYLGLSRLAPPTPLSPEAVALLGYPNMVIPFMALALVSYYFRLASMRAEQRMEAMALTDPLTGLFNRRHMGDRLREEQARAARGGRPFGVIMADVDHFKRVNDLYGHDAGDRVLVEVARLLSAGLRGHDVAARWGGEEFLLLLPDTDLEGAKTVARRIHEQSGRSLQVVQGVGEPITLTFGVAIFSGGPTVDAAIKAADLALYEGKSSGRNRVVVRDGGPTPAS
jgi:diguanylate cyclase (GGDEF)-like protein